MIRTLILVGTVMLVGANAAVAQSCDDVIKTRQSLMKRSGDMAKVGASINRGDTPFDLAKTKQIFAAYAEDAGKMPSLFPDCSKTGAKSDAAPAVWSSMAEFKALMAKFAADVKAAEENTKDAATFRTSFLAINKDCTNCHEKFRIKKN